MMFEWKQEWKFLESSDLENNMYMKPPWSDKREEKKFLTMIFWRCCGHTKGSLFMNFENILNTDYNIWKKLRKQQWQWQRRNRGEIYGATSAMVGTMYLIRQGPLNFLNSLELGF